MSVSGSMNPNMAIIVPAKVFQYYMDATFYVLLSHYLNTAARNNATCFFFTLQSYLNNVSSNDIAFLQMRLVNLLAQAYQ